MALRAVSIIVRPVSPLASRIYVGTKESTPKSLIVHRKMGGTGYQPNGMTCRNDRPSSITL
jgi:hypothetical protein